jgi:N-methylhydantoinase B
VTVLEPTRGGMGAGLGFDGVDARDASMSNLRNHPVEHIEDEFGVVIREYDVRTDSGGPGRWRGGVGQFITVEILSDSAVILCRGMERLRFPSWGVFGARPAAPFAGTLNKGKANEERLTKIDELHVRRGDTVTLYMPGGSGYGDPFQRDPERVRSDVELGFVTRPGAARDYGVALGRDGTVDEVKTRRLRGQRVKDNVRADFDFGPEREAWEAVFDDATMGELNRRLYALPKSIRQAARRRIFDHAVPDLPIAGDGTPLARVMADPDAIRARLAEVMEAVFGTPAGGP